MSAATAHAVLSSYSQRHTSVELNGWDEWLLVALQYQLRSECCAGRPSWLAEQDAVRNPGRTTVSSGPGPGAGAVPVTVSVFGSSSALGSSSAGPGTAWRPTERPR